MIFSPLGLGLFLLLVLALVAFVFLVELRVLAYAYRKIGVHPRYVFLVMVLSLVGSHVNIPVSSVPVARLAPPDVVRMFGRTYVVPPAVEQRRTVVAVNVGGALIPVAVSIYLAVRTRLFVRMAIGTMVVASVVHTLAEVVPGVGIAVPMLLPPLVAAGVALLIAFRRAPAVAYVSGAMGTLLGADLWNLSRITELGAPVVSIGGAGTFDGIFLTGIIAGLLA
jgi:uncharacterized membrane protein